MPEPSSVPNQPTAAATREEGNTHRSFLRNRNGSLPQLPAEVLQHILTMCSSTRTKKYLRSSCKALHQAADLAPTAIRMHAADWAGGAEVWAQQLLRSARLAARWRHTATSLQLVALDQENKPILPVAAESIMTGSLGHWQCVQKAEVPCNEAAVACLAAAGCSQLTKLTLTTPTVEHDVKETTTDSLYAVPSNQSIMAILSGLTTLTSLQLVWGCSPSGPADTFVFMLDFGQCTALQHLTQLQHLHVEAQTRGDFSVVINQLTRLTSLQLDLSYTTWEGAVEYEGGFGEPAHCPMNLPLLQDVSLVVYSYYKAYEAHKLVAHSYQLTRLRTSQDFSFPTTVASLPHLVHLSDDSVVDLEELPVLAACPQLTSLELSQLGDPHSIWEGGVMPALRHLKVEELADDDDASWMTRFAPKLERLSLTYPEFGGLAGHPTLAHMDVEACCLTGLSTINDTLYYSICQTLASLTALTSLDVMFTYERTVDASTWQPPSPPKPHTASSHLGSSSSSSGTCRQPAAQLQLQFVTSLVLTAAFVKGMDNFLDVAKVLYITPMLERLQMPFVLLTDQGDGSVLISDRFVDSVSRAVRWLQHLSVLRLCPGLYVEGKGNVKHKHDQDFTRLVTAMSARHLQRFLLGVSGSIKLREVLLLDSSFADEAHDVHEAVLRAVNQSVEGARRLGPLSYSVMWG